LAVREHWRRIALVGCALLTVWTFSGSARAATSPPYAGQPLAEALEALRAQGLDLLYSSQLVLPDMRVASEPRGQTPAAVLAEILAPHGLEARPLGANRFLIVRAQAPAEDRAPSAAPAPAHDARTLDEVVVHASRYALERELNTSLAVLDRQRLDSIPGVEQDAIRAMQRIPGSAASGLSALSHVRGSYEDEVLIRFDGVRLYEPFHLKDFQSLFGAVDPELIDTLDVYSGGFPIEFGDRAGAVLDISPRKTDGAEHMIGVSVFNNRAISSGSHGDGRGQWLAGYRRSNLTAVLHEAGRDVGEPQFEDYLARYEYRITPTLSAALGFLGLQDKHEIFTTDREQVANARYDDDATWLRLRYEPTDRWSLELHASHSHLSAQREGTSEREEVSSGSLDESRIANSDEIQLEWGYRPSRRLQWRTGLVLGRANANFSYDVDASFEEPLAGAFGRPPTLSKSIQTRVDGDSRAAWTSVRTEIGAAILEAGLRYDERTWLDRSGQFSPRFSLRYDLNEATVLRVSAGRFLQTQAVNELELEEDVPAFAAPESSRHLIVSLERKLNASLGLRVEAFDRDTSGVRPRFENVLDPLVLLPDIEVDRVRIAPGRSRTSGVEVTLHNDPTAPFNVWATYAWSRSEDEFDGREAPRSWDQRNSALLGVAWQGERWLLGATFGFASGWPFTAVQFEGPPNDDETGYSTVVLGPRNRERFEDRLWIDVRGEYSFALPRGELEFVAEVRNLLNYGNDCCRDVEITPEPGGTFSSETDQREWLSLLPIVAVNWRF
jgi:outer membrane receptor protein involved in Fe transport